MKKYKTEFSKEELHKALHANDEEAASILEDKGKWESFKEKVEQFIKKAEKIPVFGSFIEDIVTMVSLVDSYVRNEYDAVPKGTLLSVVGTLVYVISPIDLIPDFIPVIGYIDDIAVVSFVLNLGLNADLDKYRKWHDKKREEALAAFEESLADEFAIVISEQYLTKVVVHKDFIDLYVTSDINYENPDNCFARQVNLPREALKAYDVVKKKEILEVIDKSLMYESIKWAQGTRKKAVAGAESV